MQAKPIQKLITFSPELYRHVLSKAKRVGLSFPEYMRVLAVNDIKEEVEYIPMVDDDTEKHIAQSLEDVKSGDYTVLETPEDVEKHFKNL